MEDYKLEMGKRIKEKRKLCGLTQEQMAEKLNVSIKHYGNVERGLAGLSIENLIHLCSILGTDLNYLIVGTVETDVVALNRIKEIYLACPKKKQQFILDMFELISKL